MLKSMDELAEKLRHPSDIDNKIDSIIDKCRKNIEIKEKQIISLYQTKLCDINKISEKVENILKGIETLKGLKINGFEAIQTSQTKLKDYDVIKTIALAHKNLSKTKYFMENMESDDFDLRNKEDIEKYHTIIYEKEDFLYEILWFKRDFNDDDIRKIEDRVCQIRKLILEFTTYISKFMENFENNYESFEKINKIVRVEEKRDLITSQTKKGQFSLDPVMKQYYIENQKYTNREEKHLKNLLIDVIKSSVTSKFELLKNETEYIALTTDYLNGFEKLRKHELYFFPFNDLLKFCHACMKGFFKYKIEKADPEGFLEIIEFKTSYYEIIKNKLQSDIDTLGSSLIDNENELLDRYSKCATTKLKSWIDGITDSEIERFKIREKFINKDESGKLISPGFINLMQIIKAQLEPVKFYKSVFKSVIQVLKDKCFYFKDTIISAIQKEYKASLNSKTFSGFEDYCIMFGNSGLKLTQYFSNLEFFQDNDSRELQGIFLEILKTSNGVLSDFVIYTCKPVLCKVFTTEWIEKDLSKVLAVTLQDFLQDYVATLSDYSFSTFICDLCDKLYVSYKMQLLLPNIVLNKKTGQYFIGDYNRIKDTFSKFLEEDDFADFIRPLYNLLSLIEETNTEVFILELKSLVLNDNSINRNMILNVLDRKSDLGNEQKKSILERLNSVFNDKLNKK